MVETERNIGLLFSPSRFISASLNSRRGSSGWITWVSPHPVCDFSLIFIFDRVKSNSKFFTSLYFVSPEIFRSGPAVIVYNERGHRIEDDDIDTYPEDDQSALHGGRSDRRSEPVSRSRTPVEPYYPPGGSRSRHTSNSGIPDATRIERTASKGYSPSIAPSTRSAAYSTREMPRGSDGERTGSDSERKKGKDREREYGIEDRGFTPTGDRNRNSVYGASSIAKVASSNGGGQGQEMLSSGWGAPPSVGHPSSRSPSIKQPQSGSASIYGGGEGHFDQSNPQDFASPPKSAVDEHRQSHLWGAPQSAALDAILDRPSSPYVDGPKSPYAQDNTFDRPKSPYAQDNTFDPSKSPFVAEHTERSSSPFVHGPSAIGRSASPFVDRPKSGVEGSFFGNSNIPSSANFDDRPPTIFGNGGPPSMFGNSGLAANDGGPALFGEPPASVFGETAAADDGWGFQAAATNATSSPATTKAGKSKRKGSAAASPAVATPASGLASRNSPSLGANKSPFGRQSDFATHEEPVVAAATSSPTTGLWGSKAPSPFEKKERGLSPLNPASQIHNEPGAANDAFSWDFNGKPASGGDDGWGNVNLDDPHLQEARVPSRPLSRAASPAPPVRTASPVPPTPIPVEQPVAESMVAETSTTKKKKKKGATPAAKSPAAFTQDAAEQEEEERKKAEAEKHANEEKERLEKERLEAARQEQEEREIAEQEQLRKELEKLEADREADRLAAEMAETERQEEERAKIATVPSSVFGNNTSMFSSGGLLSSSSLNPPDKPWISTDTGGGDDGWGSWGGTTTTTKKKKGSKATTPVTPSTTKPSMFGSTGWGNFGGGIGDSSSPVAAPSPKPSPKPVPSELPSSQGHGIFDFGSTGPNLSLSGFEPTQQKSRAPSRAASPAPLAEYPPEGAPLDITSPIPDSGEAEAGPLDGEGEGAKGDEEEGALASGSKKKKKKKGGEASKEGTPTPATPQDETGVEAVNEGNTEPAATTGGGKKKKKKK